MRPPYTKFDIWFMGGLGFAMGLLVASWIVAVLR